VNEFSETIVVGQQCSRACQSNTELFGRAGTGGVVPLRMLDSPAPPGGGATRLESF